MASPKVLIFDFDGTLADSAPIIRKVYGDIAKKNNLRPMTNKDYAELRKGTLGQARRWSGMRLWQFPLVVRSIKQLMSMEAEKVQLFPGIADMIRELHSDGVTMHILSRNTSETIYKVLQRYDLQDDIKIIAGKRRTFGSKTRAIRLLVRRGQLDKQSVWMIGDEIRDIKAAHRAGVNSIAVTWGLQDKSILKKYNPTEIVTSVKKLEELIQQELRSK